MESITKIVEEQEVIRRNKLRNNCNLQLTAALKVGSKMDAIKLIHITFSYKLNRCISIVGYVRTGKTFLKAELLTESF